MTGLKKENNKIEDHKHCNRCLTVLEEMGRIPWTTKVGIVKIYQCDCGVWIDEEHGVIKEIYEIPIND